MPLFIQEQLPTALAGIAFAALLIAAVGTASGLALGVATTLKADVLRRWLADRRHELPLFRALTAAVVGLAFVLLLFNLGSAIMDWSFLSMGLRGATLCLPLLFAVFMKQYNLRRAGALSIFVAPVCVIAAGLLKVEIIPPLYLGLGVSLLIFSCAVLSARRQSS